MPTISIFFGIVRQMYWKDHPPGHIHVFHQGFEAFIVIDTGAVIGNRLRQRWPASGRVDLVAPDRAASELGSGRQNLPFERVPGADAP